jgi:hypothetical protein
MSCLIQSVNQRKTNNRLLEVPCYAMNVDTQEVLVVLGPSVNCQAVSERVFKRTLNFVQDIRFSLR